MTKDTFEESLLKQGLSQEAINVAMCITSALSSARTRSEAIQEFCAHSPESMKWEAARLKWREFSAKSIEDSDNVSSVRSAYMHTPRGSPEERSALRKWIILANTPEEILEVYWESVDMSEEQDLARNKLIAYFENLIEEYKTANA